MSEEVSAILGKTWSTESNTYEYEIQWKGHSKTSKRTLPNLTTCAYLVMEYEVREASTLKPKAEMKWYHLTDPNSVFVKW